MLPFSQPSGRHRRRSRVRDGEKGTILLFTGVRYERMTDEQLSGLLAGLPRPGDTDLRIGG